MKKLLTLFTLLLTVCSGAWATDYYTPTADEVIIFNDAYNSSKSSSGYSNHSAIKFYSAEADKKTKTVGNPNDGDATVSGTSFSIKNGNDKKRIDVNITGVSKIIVYHESHASRYVRLLDLNNSSSLIASGTTGVYYNEFNLTGSSNYSIRLEGYDGSQQQDLYVYAVKLIKASAAPGTISFDPAAGSVETGSSITLSSTGATTIYYQWGASVIDGEGNWEGASTYADNAKPTVPAYGSSNNVLSVKATNTYGSTYGSATYTITAPKAVTTTTISSDGITNLDYAAGTAAGTLTATVMAGSTPVEGAIVTWSSSDATIATVGETTGVVTLVAAGTAQITATYAGDETHAGSSDTYEIEVTDSRHHVTFSFSTTSITDYNFDGETLTAPILTAKDEGDNTIDLAELTGLTFAESHASGSNATVTVNSTTGALTAQNSFGTSTITVSFTGNANYKAAESKSYTVTRAPYLRQVLFDNGFDAFIKENDKTVEVYYMEGTDAPAQTGEIQVAEGFTAEVVGNNVVLTQTATSKVKTYAISKTPVTPFVGAGKQTFSDVPSYVASVYGYTSDKGLKFSKTDNNWQREAPGNTRIYFFVGPADAITLTHKGTARAVKVRINGGDATDMNGTITDLALNANQNNMIEIQSNQTNGDGGYQDMTLTAPKQAIKIGSHGWTSLISDKNLNFEGIEGLNAYRAKLSETTVTLNDVTEVDANKGIVLKGTASATYYVPVLASTEANIDTDLTGSATAAYDKVGGKYYYVLANKGGVEGFYEYTGDDAIPAGKAFFETSSQIAEGKFSIVFADDETDGIKAVSTKVENGVRYNLAGQRVGNDYKGIVIVNGRKMLNK